MSVGASVKKASLILFVSFSLLAIALPASAFTWTVTLPTDAPYYKCTVHVYAKGVGNGHMADLGKGQTVQWSSNEPLTYADGICEGAFDLMTRYCNG